MAARKRAAARSTTESAGRAAEPEPAVDEQPASVDEPAGRVPVRRYRMAAEPPARRAGGYVLTERGWVLER